MSNSNEREYSNIFPEPLANIFTQLRPLDVEQFYQAYQLWILQKRIELQQLQIATLQEHIAENAKYMQQVAPSSLALSILAQLQAHGVDDVDLLDRMLERGESWLDNTMQLLEHCESLDMIQGDYNQWCENALEGAFTWITSMNEASQSAPSSTLAETPSIQQEYSLATEEIMLQKLMSEDGTPSIPLDAQSKAIVRESLTSEQGLSSSEQVTHAENMPDALEQIPTEQGPPDPLELIASEPCLSDTLEPDFSEQDSLNDSAAIAKHNTYDDASALASAEQETLTISEPIISVSSTIEPSQEEVPLVQDIAAQTEESNTLSNETTAAAITTEQAQTDLAEITSEAVLHSTVTTHTQTTDESSVDLTVQSAIEIQETHTETEETISDQDQSEDAPIEIALAEAKIDTVPLDAISLEAASTTITDVELTLIENDSDNELPLIEDTTLREDLPGKAMPEISELVAETLDVQTIVEPLANNQPEVANSSELLETYVDEPSIASAHLEVTTQTPPQDEHIEANSPEQPVSTLYTETISQQADSNHKEVSSPRPPLASFTEITSPEVTPLRADQALVTPIESAPDPEALPSNAETLEDQPEALALAEQDNALSDALVEETTFIIKRNPAVIAKWQDLSVSEPAADGKNGDEDKDDTTVLYALKIAPDPQITDVLPVLKPGADHKNTGEGEKATQPLRTEELPGDWEDQVYSPLGDLPEQPTLTGLSAPPILQQMTAPSTELQQQNTLIVQQTAIEQKKPGFWKRLWALLWG